MIDDYESRTRSAYRNADRANRYKAQHQGDLSWARFAMWREVRSVRRAVTHFGVLPEEMVLDVPCGTGVAGPALCSTGAQVLAADISREMMGLARPEYDASCFRGFTQLDITRLPFRDESVTGAVILGFMHRVPKEIKHSALAEAVRVSRRLIVVSYTVDSLLQRLKKKILKWIRPGYGEAPRPLAMSEILQMFSDLDLRLVHMTRVAPLLSGEVVFWLARGN